MQQSITIQKHPQLPDSENYDILRQQGLMYIQQLGSDLWTDYNIHDPGITILELLCYAITDLGYRTSFDIKDLLAVKLTETPNPRRQAFYTAREILTINPWTTNDYRKLLIDIDGVKNAWIQCRQCPCDDLFLYANCKKSVLQYEPTEHTVIIKGLYDVLIEFENEEGVGDLNSGKITYSFSFASGATFSTAMIEMRLPSWHQLEANKVQYQPFRSKNSKIQQVTVQFISGNKGDNVDIPSNQWGNTLRRTVYATFDVTFTPDDATPAITQTFTDIPLHVWFNSDADRKAVQLGDIKNAIQDASAAGIMAKYLSKVKRADEVMEVTKGVLQSHRNLCEDYCSIDAVEVEDIAVCADMEVTPDADIEAVLATAYFLIDQYFSPDIQFYSLQQLLQAGKTVDEIFEGPPLHNGFIDDDQLESTNLKKVLYTSDIINLLMDIPGVKAIRNFVLARYNDEGILVESQPWELTVTYNHQPRLYIEGSKFLVFKNGLPFLPDKLELSDTLQVIKGQHAQPKFSVLDLDLPVPKGVYYNLQEYYPLQYSLPLTYGVGYDGLPSTVSIQRKAQAKQLKAYLLFYEQLLVNYLEQLSHLKELFAVDDTVTQTYFSKLISEGDIVGVDELWKDLTAPVLHDLIETNDEFLDRRNRFLDHLLARFAEQFNDYALMLYSYTDNKAIADDQLIKNKVAFLKDVPFMSSNRARAFNYKDAAHVCSNENIAGLKTRIERLLGFDTSGGNADPEKIFIVEHLLLRPRNKKSADFPDGDPLLSICIPPDCSLCGEEDPYSFRLTVVLDGEKGAINSNMDFRRFAEQTIRMEVPAHLGVKICWVATDQLSSFEQVYCDWLAELAKPEPDVAQLSNKLKDLIAVFEKLKSVYPKASLHDCVDGDDTNRVYLDNTII